MRWRRRVFLCGWLQFLTANAGTSFAHVVNLLPFEDVGQRIALASWLYARDVARTKDLKVSLYTVEVANEPRVYRDAAFQPLPDLIRTARHTMATENVKIPSLPLLRDVLERALGLPEDFIVLTIADLGFLPDFYAKVRDILREVEPSQALSILRVGIGNWSRHVVRQGRWKAGEGVYLKPFFDLALRCTTGLPHFPNSILEATASSSLEPPWRRLFRRLATSSLDRRPSESA